MTLRSSISWTNGRRNCCVDRPPLARRRLRRRGEVKDLERIGRATKAMTENGAIQVVHRKGRCRHHDFANAKSLGLTYTKVARVSETHTAEKLVRPVATRGRQ
jgi:hypothetical protein